MDFYGKEKGLFDLLTETISEGIVIVNAKQTIVTLNETLAQLFGYNKEELIGESLEILIPQRYHHNHSSHVKTFLKNSEKRIMGQGRELFGIRKDGSQFPLEVGLKPFQSNGEINVMALVIDITLRKQHEQELKDLNNQLEQKVSERTQELQDSIVQLENEIDFRFTDVPD